MTTRTESAIQPFQVSVPEEAIADLRRRIAETRRPVKETVSDFHEVDRGGHIAAWEQPELFSSEIRPAFRSLR